MKPTRQLYDLGQHLWLDNISRELLDNEILNRYIDEFSITGLTSNPSIFDAAIGSGEAYDKSILEKSKAGKYGESLFIELALEDLRRAADLFLTTFNTSQHTDGWVSMEISPLLSDNVDGSINAARQIFQQADRPNLFVKIPGTLEGIQAIEELIFAGVPINVTLLFSCEHYLAAAEAHMRGIERRINAGLNARVDSVASLFVSRWDVAIKDKVPKELQNKLGIAICQRTYRAYRKLLASPRWIKLSNAGAYPQRLLWASTGSKDPSASESLYIDALAAPGTINTIPEKTLLAFAKHGSIKSLMTENDGDAELILSRFTQAGVDINALALELQQEGTKSFVKSWQHLLQSIAAKSVAQEQTF